VREEVWISVDVETSGPTPAMGSLVAIGACLVDRPDVGFYIEILPLDDRPWGETEERIHGLTHEHLNAHGVSRREAVRGFAAWIEDQVAAAVPHGTSADPAERPRPVFVALNATFDWMWIADAFLAELGANPFGPSGIDIKALYLGRHWGEVRHWGETSGTAIARRFGVEAPHVHHALDDARRQADMARRVLGIEIRQLPAQAAAHP
jgi:ribonuclease T